MASVLLTDMADRLLVRVLFLEPVPCYLHLKNNLLD